MKLEWFDNSHLAPIKGVEVWIAHGEHLGYQIVNLGPRRFPGMPLGWSYTLFMLDDHSNKEFFRLNMPRMRPGKGLPRESTLEAAQHACQQIEDKAAKK